MTTENDGPTFPNPGGNVFGFLAPQWVQLFQAKIDSDNGTATNLTVNGLVGLTFDNVVQALGYIPLETMLALPNNEIYLGSAGVPVASTLSAAIDAAIGSTRGAILERGSAGWQMITPGTSGYLLTSNGAGADPSYQAPGGLPALAQYEIFQGNGSSVATAVTLSAALDAAIGNTQGDLLYRNATVWTVLPPGTSGEFLQTQGAAANPQWASPSGSGTVSAGTTNQVAIYAASGTTVSGEGLSALIDAVIGSTQGDILYRNGAVWTVLAPGTAGQLLETSGAAANPVWAALSSILDLLDGSSSATRGAILERGASSWQVILPGTAGTVLTSNGSGADPSYQVAGTSFTYRAVGTYAIGSYAGNLTPGTTGFAGSTLGLISGAWTCMGVTLQYNPGGCCEAPVNAIGLFLRTA